MIHLFKKVYVSSDRFIDSNFDRIVVSETTGVELLHSLIKSAQGNLLDKGKNFDEVVGKDKTFSDWVNFFERLNEHQITFDKKFVLYCDDVSMMRLLSAWFKLILPNATKESIKNLINSYVYKYNIFYKGRFSINNGNLNYNSKIDTSSFSEQYDLVVLDETKKIKTNIKSNVGIEFILSSYLKNGSFKEELKNILKILLKKDLEKYLYELKEIFFVHLMTKKFTNLLGFEKDYTLDNLTEIENDKSKFVNLFLNEKIWNYKYMSHPSSSRNNISLTEITEEDIENFKEFTIISGSVWNEESIYSFVKSDINKLDFLGCFTDFTDELLDKIIETESEFEHAAGSFFSIDLETVNHYLITAILESNKLEDKSFIERHALV